MITPKAAHLLIRHLDSLDRAVSKRLARKRPWSEPALTSLLCDLMDSETQPEEPLDYSLSDLNRDLRELEGLLSVSIQIETHEYDSNIERWVTQADLGFVINFQDHLLPHDSWRVSWLLQAKRLYPDSRNPLSYSEVSRFGGMDPKQAARIERLIETVQLPFVLYLLYCPRPAALDDMIQRKLAHLRNRQLSSHIFDFSLGLELHGDLGTAGSTLAAGIFICPPSALPKTLGAVHGSVLQHCCPISWFFASHFVESGFFPIHRDRMPGLPGPGRRRRGSPPNGPEEWANGIVSGDVEAIDRLIGTLGETNDGPFPVLPRHTLTIDIEVGHDLDPERRRIREE